MFERIKKALGVGDARQGPPSGHAWAEEWASTQGLSFAERPEGHGFMVSGQVEGRPWRLERGGPSRPFIQGQELRARAELELRGELAIMVMNRGLKEMLEGQAYAHYTDSLQTMVDAGLTEEVRWLSMFQEVGWEAAPPAFWQRYAVLAEFREPAQQWLDDALTGLLLGWPQEGPGPQTPFILTVQRGKVYLRMEYAPSDVATLAHATTVFTGACQAALANLPRHGL